MSDPRGNGTGAITPDSLPLERKLPLLVLGLFTLVLATSLVISYYEERRSAIEMAGERLAALGQAFAAISEQGAVQRLTLLRRASRDTAVINALRAPTAQLSSKAIQALGTLYVTAADTATPPELWDSRAQPLGVHRLETTRRRTTRSRRVDSSRGRRGSRACHTAARVERTDVVLHRRARARFEQAARIRGSGTADQLQSARTVGQRRARPARCGHRFLLQKRRRQHMGTPHRGDRASADSNKARARFAATV